MNNEQKEKIELLNQCDLQGGGDEKFVKEFFRKQDAELSKKQSDTLNMLFRKYRFQIGKLSGKGKSVFIGT